MRHRRSRLVIEIDLDAARLAGLTPSQAVMEVARSRPIANGRLIPAQPRTLETDEGIAVARMTLYNKHAQDIQVLDADTERMSA